MTDHEKPMHGGRYHRGKDGKLTRVDDSAPADTDAAKSDGKAAASKPKAEK